MVWYGTSGGGIDFVSVRCMTRWNPREEKFGKEERMVLNVDGSLNKACTSSHETFSEILCDVFTTDRNASTLFSLRKVTCEKRDFELRGNHAWQTKLQDSRSRREQTQSIT